jgi:hypothetical protein
MRYNLHKVLDIGPNSVRSVNWICVVDMCCVGLWICVVWGDSGRGWCVGWFLGVVEGYWDRRRVGGCRLVGDCWVGCVGWLCLCVCGAALCVR